jgi:putative flippase GtrA
MPAISDSWVKLMTGRRPAQPGHGVLRRLHPLLRFSTVGVINTLVYYACYLPLLLALPYVVAHVLAWLVATVVSFALNCRWTYGVPPTLRRALLYPFSATPNLLLTTVGVTVLVQILGVPEQWAPLIAGLAAVPLTYLTARWLLVTVGGRRGHASRVRTDPSNLGT